MALRFATNGIARFSSVVSMDWGSVTGKPNFAASATTDTTNADNITGGSQTGTGAMVRATAIRGRLTANRTYYVLKTGLNSNTGLVNTAGGAWLTLQYAIDFISQNLDLGGYAIVVQVGDGTYTENLQFGGYLSSGRLVQGAAILQGNASNHSAVVISPASGNAITNSDTGPFGWTVKNLKIISVATGVYADYDAKIYLDGVVFGACNIHVLAGNAGAFIEFINNPYVVAGNAAVHAEATSLGQVLWQSVATCSFSGTPSISSAWLLATAGGLVDCSSAGIFSGLTATGAGFTYIQNYGGVIRTSSDANPNSVLPAELAAGSSNIWPVQAGISYTNLITNVKSDLGITTNGTAAVGQLPGTTTNDSAAAGKVGEYLSSTVVTGSAVALTTNTVANITSLSLTAGDWDVWINGYINPAVSTVVNVCYITMSAANNTLDQTAGKVGVIPPFISQNQPVSAVSGPYRISLSGTTSVYFNIYAGFTTSTLTGWGIIQARRVR